MPEYLNMLRASEVIDDAAHWQIVTGDRSGDDDRFFATSTWESQRENVTCGSIFLCWLPHLLLLVPLTRRTARTAGRVLPEHVDNRVVFRLAMSGIARHLTAARGW
jgi:hypothetical protein